MPRVARINISPIKSTSLHHPSEVFLSELGVEGDHRFLFLDEDGRRLTEGGKAPLLGIRADLDTQQETLTLTFPDGSATHGTALPSGELQRITLYDREVDVRLLNGGLADAASRHAGRPLRLARVEPPEYAGGERRVSIMTDGSLDDLGRRGGLEFPPDPRRFRMLFELEGCAPYEEDGWDGQVLSLGEALVRVGSSIPRCALTTMHPDTGRKDFPTLDVLATYRKTPDGLMFGAYGDVERPGRVAVGDTVELA
jgi:uncharacterized protein YcbX